MLDFVLHVTKMIINLQYACNDDKNNHWIVIILVQIMLRNISEEHMGGNLLTVQSPILMSYFLYF